MVDFWEVHGFFFIFFMMLFPRLTLLFSSVAFGGFLWFLGWLFVPRLLVAILATTAYWDTNTFLVILTWMWSLGGTSRETRIIKKKIIYKH